VEDPLARRADSAHRVILADIVLRVSKLTSLAMVALMRPSFTSSIIFEIFGFTDFSSAAVKPAQEPGKQQRLRRDAGISCCGIE